mmetsp:Transcript_44481/g.112540  ORF Transcript_44481/g.112540 Transcript_44481/m.112540 type:complete len:203 (-) Transcript_44481:965-1573(-)
MLTLTFSSSPALPLRMSAPSAFFSACAVRAASCTMELGVRNDRGGACLPTTSKPAGPTGPVRFMMLHVACRALPTLAASPPSISSTESVWCANPAQWRSSDTISSAAPFNSCRSGASGGRERSAWPFSVLNTFPLQAKVAKAYMPRRCPSRLGSSSLLPASPATSCAPSSCSLEERMDFIMPEMRCAAARSPACAATSRSKR